MRRFGFRKPVDMGPYHVPILRKWTREEETELIKIVGEGASRKEIGKRLGRVEKGIKIRVYKMMKEGRL